MPGGSSGDTGTGPAGTSINGVVPAAIDVSSAYEFSLGGPIDSHHDQARCNWHATAPGESESAYVGFDVILATDGKIQRSMASSTAPRWLTVWVD